MPEHPLISILTPTRNRRDSFLPLAIASVRALRLDCAWEHIVVDDGSDDDTAGFLATEVANDSRLCVVRHDRPRGVAAARNSAARAARGDFLVDLDDDDLLLADGVARRYRYLRAHPEFWAVHANALKIDEAGHYLIGQDVRNFLCTDLARCARHFYDSTMIPNASTAMYRRAELLALGGWEEALSCCEDYDLWLRSLERYGPPGFLAEPVALYRCKEHSLGIDSIRNGVHERNQRLLKARWAHLVSTPAAKVVAAQWEIADPGIETISGGPLLY
jgi:glycosyltransferase involved in cell wall biosynthesis